MCNDDNEAPQCSKYCSGILRTTTSAPNVNKKPSCECAIRRHVSFKDIHTPEVGTLPYLLKIEAEKLKALKNRRDELWEEMLRVRKKVKEEKDVYNKIMYEIHLHQRKTWVYQSQVNYAFEEDKDCNEVVQRSSDCCLDDEFQPILEEEHFIAFESFLNDGKECKEKTCKCNDEPNNNYNDAECTIPECTMPECTIPECTMPECTMPECTVPECTMAECPTCSSNQPQMSCIPEQDDEGECKCIQEKDSHWSKWSPLRLICKTLGRVCPEDHPSVSNKRTIQPCVQSTTDIETNCTQDHPSVSNKRTVQPCKQSTADIETNCTQLRDYLQGQNQNQSANQDSVNNEIAKEEKRPSIESDKETSGKNNRRSSTAKITFDENNRRSSTAKATTDEDQRRSSTAKATTDEDQPRSSTVKEVENENGSSFKIKHLVFNASENRGSRESYSDQVGPKLPSTSFAHITKFQGTNTSDLQERNIRANEQKANNTKSKGNCNATPSRSSNATTKRWISYAACNKKCNQSSLRSKSRRVSRRSSSNFDPNNLTPCEAAVVDELCKQLNNVCNQESCTRNCRSMARKYSEVLFDTRQHNHKDSHRCFDSDSGTDEEYYSFTADDCVQPRCCKTRSATATCGRHEGNSNNSFCYEDSTDDDD